MKKVWLILGMLVFAASIQGTVFAQEQESKEEDYVVGKVGSDEIYISEINKVASRLNRFLKENYEKSSDWRLNFIRNYIAQAALSKRAVKEGLEKDKEITEEIERVKRSLLAEKMLQNAINQGLKANQENLEKFYQENKDKYQTKAKIKLSYIKEKNKEQLVKITKLLEKGKSFEKAAGKKAVGIESWVSKDEHMLPEAQDIFDGGILDILMTLEKGANSEILEIKDEFYVFHIVDKEQAKDKPFEEVRQQVEFQYTTEEKERIVTELVMETFKLENVEIYEDKAVLETK
ncbi:MAG: peptidylprolyl isomerase [Candidatus Omnitrophota bacterium]